MRIFIYIILICLLVLCIRKIRKMLKDSQAIDLDEGRNPVSGGRVIGIFAGGALITGLCLWFFLSMGTPDLGSKHNIEKYTFNNHVLSFDVPNLEPVTKFLCRCMWTSNRLIKWMFDTLLIKVS